MEAIAREDKYEHATTEVMYVASNIPGPGINIEEFESEFSDGCSCKLKCFENCSCTRGIVNYIDGNIFDEKVAGPIIECNAYCECSENCGNRLVQRGPLDCLIVSEMSGKGYGLLTSMPIKKGQFICEYAGEVISVDEAKHRVESNKRDNVMNYVLVVFEHMAGRIIKTCIDPKYFGNIGRYSNHSCEPNSILVPIRVEGMIPRLCLFAIRDIENGEEITFNYAGGVVNSVKNLSETPCLCGSTVCLRYLPHHPI